MDPVLECTVAVRYEASESTCSLADRNEYVDSERNLESPWSGSE